MDKAKNEIILWFSTGRDYRRGVELYRRWGVNLRLKKMFALEQTDYNRQALTYELQKIAGLTDRQVATMRRVAMPGVTAQTPAQTPTQKTVAITNVPDDNAREKKRLRQKYTFLSEPSCPDELKILVADLFTSHTQYTEAHRRLATGLREGDADAARTDAETVVESYLDNREIFDELDYYLLNGQILGKCRKLKELRGEKERGADVTDIPDIELMGRFRSAQAQISKHRKRIATAKERGTVNQNSETQVEYWTGMRDLYRREIDRRKKK